MMGTLPPAWNPDHDDHLVCVAIRPETADVSTFVFAAPEPRLFRFLPGQFIMLNLRAAGVQRCYTIASPPTRPWRIEVTAKRAATGLGSGWLHGSLRPGMRVAASGPMGDFTLEPRAGQKLLLLSAGSGITPLMSMARTAQDLGIEADILFVHSARIPADLIFDAELAAMARHPGFRRVSVVEAVPQGMAWDGHTGRLSPELLRLLAPDLAAREVFCCGPAPYMAAARSMLDALGFDRSRYHEESFDFAAGGEEEAAAPPPDLLAGLGGQAKPGTDFTVRFARTGCSVSCPAGTTVLAAARAAGIRLPAACNRGVCGTCKSRLVSGAVALKHGGGIRPAEIEAGLTLLCCARPTADLVVDR